MESQPQNPEFRINPKKLSPMQLILTLEKLLKSISVAETV